MARRLRHAPGGLVYHLLNRGNAREEIFRCGREDVDRPQSVEEEEALRRCMAKSRPHGSEVFVEWTTELLELQSSHSDAGHPLAAKDGCYDS